MNAGQDFSSQLKCISTIEAMRTVKPRGAVTVVCGGNTQGTTACSGDKIFVLGNQNPNRFYLRTNNATK